MESKWTIDNYKKSYNDRMDKAFKDMKKEGLEDYDSHQFIVDEGDFTSQEVVGYYYETYRDKAKEMWESNTKDRDKRLSEAYRVRAKQVDMIFSQIENRTDSVVYPFKEGDDYWTIEDGEIIWSCWDDVSEEMHDKNPNKEYFITKESAINYLKQ